MTQAKLKLRSLQLSSTILHFMQLAIGIQTTTKKISNVTKKFAFDNRQNIVFTHMQFGQISTCR